MLMSKAAERCIESKRSQGTKPGTLRNYRNSIRNLIDVVGDRPIGSYTPYDIDLMANSLSDSGIQDSTINRITDNLSAIFKWAIWAGDLKVARNPVQGRRRRPVKPKDRLRVPLEGFGPLLAQEGHERDRILVAVGLFMFLRQSEMRALRIKDIDLSTNTLQVYVQKTNETDLMKIPHELRPYFRSWLTYYTEEVGPLHPEFFLIPAKNPDTLGSTLRPNYPMNNISGIVKSWLEKGGYAVQDDDGGALGEGAHSLRRSGALAFFRAQSERGVDDALRLTMSLLHHKQVSTTETYLGLKSEKERRNKILDEAPMFPGLVADNVFKIGDSRGNHSAQVV